MLRTVFKVCAIGGFAALAVTDLLHGHVRAGVAALMLSLANLLLLP